MLCFYLKVLLIKMNPSPNPQSQVYIIDEVQNQISGEEPILFDWHNRWLKGHEYEFILKNINAYCKRYGFNKFQYKTHPVSIYQMPVNGMIYFVKGNGVGSDFGFPRVAKKKRYRWKKMNFTTDLPKQKPLVTYVVASAMKSQQIVENEEIPNFRMHAVIPFKDRLKQYPEPVEYILCHVRRVERKKVEIGEVSLKSCVSSNSVDFYKLFAFLHNFSLPTDKTDHFSL